MALNVPGVLNTNLFNTSRATAEGAGSGDKAKQKTENEISNLIAGSGITLEENEDENEITISSKGPITKVHQTFTETAQQDSTSSTTYTDIHAMRIKPPFEKNTGRIHVEGVLPVRVQSGSALVSVRIRWEHPTFLDNTVTELDQINISDAGNGEIEKVLKLVGGPFSGIAENAEIAMQWKVSGGTVITSPSGQSAIRELKVEEVDDSTYIRYDQNGDPIN